ncbi:hypothetical protein NIA69_16095 [Gemmiger formicilis]|nr:hypothetical protein [Gemmiger formicilis]
MMKLPAKVGVLVLDLLAAVLVLYSVSLIFLSNFNMGNLMVWLLTVCVAGYAVFRRPLSLWFSAGAGRVVFWVLAVLAGVYLALIAFVSVSGYMNPPTGTKGSSSCWGPGCIRISPASSCNAA